VVWKTILSHTDRPAALALTRQNVPTLDPDAVQNAWRGAYVLAEASDGRPKVLLMPTGSEVQIALAAREQLEAAGTSTRVVSVPCVEWFRAQDAAYRSSVLPPDVRARVSIEAGVAQSWWEFLGDAGVPLSLEHFGASAPFGVLFEQFGLTAEHAVAAAHASLAKLALTTRNT